MSLRQAAQQALEALEDAPYMSNKDDYARLAKVIGDLRAALDRQPQLTHTPQCWAWGSQHYECATARIAKLHQAIDSALKAIEGGEPFGHLDNVLAPKLRKVGE